MKSFKVVLIAMLLVHFGSLKLDAQIEPKINPLPLILSGDLVLGCEFILSDRIGVEPVIDYGRTNISLVGLADEVTFNGFGVRAIGKYYFNPERGADKFYVGPYFKYKGGIGTSSRIVPVSFGGYTVGVLVQSNFGGVLEINGVPIAKELGNIPKQFDYDVDGSCMIVIITNAPLDARNLERLAKRAIMGLAKTGGIASNGSGDYVIAMSTAKNNLIPYSSDSMLQETETLRNDGVSPLFLATIEATEEAILNSLFAAETMVGSDGHKIESIPIKIVLDIMKKYNRIKKK